MVDEEIGQLTTESFLVDSEGLDTFSTLQILELMNRQDSRVVEAVRSHLDEIAGVVEAILPRWTQGGRLIYLGAGTSGRLGILDASECPPTFGVEPDRVIGLIAGGFESVRLSREGAEDSISESTEQLAALELTSADTVVGVAASGRTPYVLSGLTYAQQQGALTIFLCTNKMSRPSQVDHLIAIEVGPEILTGSTRLKSGTACKMVLNMISTSLMIRSGRCYGNLMVDLIARSEKLRARSRRILKELLGIDRDAAQELLVRCGGQVKLALMVGMTGLSPEESRERLDAAEGRLRLALEAFHREPRS